MNSLLVGKCKNSCLNNGSSFCVKEHSCHVHFSLITKGLGRGTIVISEFFWSIFCDFLVNTEAALPIGVEFLFGWVFLHFFFSVSSLSPAWLSVVYHGLGNFCVLLVGVCTWKAGSVDAPGALDVQVLTLLKVQFCTTLVWCKYRLAWKKLPAASPSPALLLLPLYPAQVSSDQWQSRRSIPSSPQAELCCQMAPHQTLYKGARGHVELAFLAMAARLDWA